mmetsp:Transcript_30017/g.67726  ORF Transcript_30017/g.67726 Transcript_30017/m.67726 type:complete len:500 (-) Transcript_30017:40-1539(-)
MNTKLTTLLAIATIIGSLSPVDGDKYQNLRGKDTLSELVEEESAGSSAEWHQHNHARRRGSFRAVWYKPHFQCGYSAPANFVNNEMKRYHADFIGVSEYKSKGRINDRSYGYGNIHSQCGPSVIDLYYDDMNWSKVHELGGNRCTYSHSEKNKYGEKSVGGRPWAAGLFKNKSSHNEVCVVVAEVPHAVRHHKLDRTCTHNRHEISGCERNEDGTSKILGTSELVRGVERVCGDTPVVFMADSNIQSPSISTSSMFMSSHGHHNPLADLSDHSTPYTCCNTRSHQKSTQYAMDRIAATNGKLKVETLEGGSKTKGGTVHFPGQQGYICKTEEEHAPLLARISFAGKDTQLSDYSTELVEEESGGTEWPLVPTSHFFTHGKGHEKKPQGDWYYPHHNGEMVVHMSRPPHAKCTLTGGSGPYNFGFGQLHKDEHYCKNTKCWVFPVCSPIHEHGKGNTGTCTWGHEQHQDCHVLIMQTPGHTYYHKTLQKELSKTDWVPYK